MKAKYLSLITFMFIHFTITYGQKMSPQVIASSGGYSSSGKNISWTIGQTVTGTFSSITNKLTQGFQQAEINICLLNVRVFLEGFYKGNSQMKSVINPQTFPLLTDTVQLQLASNTFPFTVIYSSNAVLRTDGNVIFKVPVNVLGKNYYFILKHRNTLETWSTNPVNIKYNVKYDFTTGINKAFGNGLSDLRDGKFALYQGDVNQNGAIDSSDIQFIEMALQSFTIGYLNSDLTGDNITESSDYSLIENNYGRIKSRP